MDGLEAIIRWGHVVAGITWIGLLYFFNWVNTAFVPTMDAETKKKVIPELIPRTLYWFRWGALWTWVTGLLLLLMHFYHSGAVFEGGSGNFGRMTIAALMVTFLGVLVYDVLAKAVKDNRLMASMGLVLIALAITIFQGVGFGYRGYVIHIGTMFGTIMAFNVWMRIWPAQRIIIAATRDGQAPPADKPALASQRSKHNTYLSVPLVWTMIDQHTTFYAGSNLWLLLAVAVGWAVVYLCYRKAAQVKGF
jgi:uncharacterized membrane protein